RRRHAQLQRREALVRAGLDRRPVLDLVRRARAAGDPDRGGRAAPVRVLSADAEGLRPAAELPAVSPHAAGVCGARRADQDLRGRRQGIGYVTQETLLFHDTIRANLLWACPDADATALEDALRAAAAWEFVRQLPDGLDTVVGDRGMRLSGGERQRLALARAL